MIEIEYPYKDILIKEIDFIRTKILETNDIREKIFYYSGIYGIFHRIFNLEYNTHLQFADFVFNTTYNALLTRYNVISSGDTLIPLDNEIFNKIVLNCEKIIEKIKKDEDIYQELENIVNVVHLATGNGHYLRKKGII